MGKISTGATFGINSQQAQAARLMAEGKNDDEVILLMWGGPLSPAEKGRHTRQLRKWAREPGFAECYRAIVKEMAFQPVGAATAKIISQINDKNGWLANKAANDVLTRFGPAILGGDEKEVVVRVEGMPLLGMPDAAQTE